MDQFEALEVAKLAAMVGGQLKTIDQSHQDRTNNPANKIDLNVFKAQAQDPSFKALPANYLTNVPEGFAPPIPEELIAQQIPDVLPQYIPQPQQQNFVSASPLPPNTVNLPHIVQSAQPEQKYEFAAPKPLFTRSDIDSIRNSLKGIDKSLAGLLNYFKNSKSEDE